MHKGETKMIMILWLAVLLYVMPLTVELPEWCNTMLLFCALALYFVALIMWNNFTSKVEELEKKVKKLTEDKELK
jgi:membrane protein implicated in regulation of membrane protease activity